MQYVVFSDIHGNLLALKQMLKDTENMNVYGYIFCGDIIGYYDHGEEIVEIISKLPNFIGVCGNHDRNYLDLQNKTEKEIMYLKENYGNSYCRKISENTKSYLQNLQCTKYCEIEGMKVVVCHGSLEKSLEGRIYPDTEVCKISEYQKVDICFLGHTHYRMERHIGDTRIINPGSLGQPRDGKGFSYCIFDFRNKKNTFYEVKLDKKALISELEEREENKTVREYLIRRLNEE